MCYNNYADAPLSPVCVINYDRYTRRKTLGYEVLYVRLRQYIKISFLPRIGYYSDMHTSPRKRMNKSLSIYLSTHRLLSFTIRAQSMAAYM